MKSVNSGDGQYRSDVFFKSVVKEIVLFSDFQSCKAYNRKYNYSKDFNSNISDSQWLLMPSAHNEGTQGTFKAHHRLRMKKLF